MPAGAKKTLCEHILWYSQGSFHVSSILRLVSKGISHEAAVGQKRSGCAQNIQMYATMGDQAWVAAEGTVFKVRPLLDHLGALVAL